LELSERKKKILQIVVDDYIETAIPVSSKAISEKYMSDISSATIRSELSALEELGYLSQPHTSAGRIPSADAYKLYVSELMVKETLSKKELDYIKKIFLEKSNNVENILKSAVKVISDLTNYTSISVAASNNEDKIREIKFYRFRPTQALVLLVTDEKLLKDNFISIPESMTDDQLLEANDVVNKIFVGKSFDEIINLKDDILQNYNEYREIFVNVIEALKEYFDESDSKILMEGENKIFEHQEFTDINKIKDFLSVVTSKDKIVNILTDDKKDIKINVKIGSEGYDDIPEDCSVVSATYVANGKKLGTYGVIGPARMDYQKTIAVLENVGKIIESIIQNK